MALISYTFNVYVWCRADTFKIEVTVILICLLWFLVPVIAKRLMDVKLGELGSWLGGRDFTPNGLLSGVRKGELHPPPHRGGHLPTGTGPSRSGPSENVFPYLIDLFTLYYTDRYWVKDNYIRPLEIELASVKFEYFRL